MSGQFGGLENNFREDIVTGQSRALPNVLYALCWCGIVLFGIYAFLMLQMLMIAFSVQTLLLFAVSLGAAVGLFFLRDRVKVEYEYTFTNGTLEFARVFRSVRRQELGSMNIRNINACGHVSHQSFQRFLSMKDVEKKNWFINRDGNLFYLYYVRDNRKHMIIIEPSEEMVDLFRKYLEPGVFQG